MENNWGIFWKTPFRVAANSALRVGENTLELQVTNLWVNRMIGDEQLPEDSVRTPEGLLKSWPQWLLDVQTGRQTFATYRVWKSDAPLQESGLLGTCETVCDSARCASRVAGTTG